MSLTADNQDRPLKPLKWYQKLATARGRLDAGAFLVEGERAIKQILDYHPDGIMEIIAREETLATHYPCPIRLVSDSQLRRLSQTKNPQGIMAVVRLPAEIYSDKLPDDPGSKILLLEDIQDPGNVGTLIRTAAAFDFSGVTLSEKCADPLAPKSVQSTAGAVLSLWLRRTSHYLKLVKALKARGYRLVTTELEGDEDTSVLSRHCKLLLALGNEAAGLSPGIRHLSDHRLRIPAVREKAESLNVAACGAICMHLSTRRL